MAIPIASAIVRTIKVGLKRAALSSIKKSGIETVALKSIASGKITDAQALLLNRLKSKPSIAIKNLITRELGLNSKEVNIIIDSYKQTAEMKKAGLGDTFKRLAAKQLQSTFGIKRGDKIADIVQKISDKTAVTGGDGSNSNTYVYALLTQLERELEEKVKGALENDFGTLGGVRTVNIDVNVTKYFNPVKNYTEKHEFNLEQLLTTLSKDIEYYTEGSHQDIYLLGDGSPMHAYSKQVINAYVSGIKLDVKSILSSKG